MVIARGLLMKIEPVPTVMPTRIGMTIPVLVVITKYACTGKCPIRIKPKGGQHANDVVLDIFKSL
jgi:hypothetical protein